METIFDEWQVLQCNQCKYHRNNCKRITDAKKIDFACAWFMCEPNGVVCHDFEPADYCKWLKAHWTNIDEIAVIPEHCGNVAFIINGDRSIRYKVPFKLYYYNDFINSDGSLKWVEKEYYQQTRKTPTGYILIHEKR